MSKDHNIHQLVIENIIRLREQKGWRKSDLARHADIDASHISNIELGKKGVGLDYLARIAEALGVEPYVMLQKHRVEEFTLGRKLEEMEKLPKMKRDVIEQMVNAFLRESQSTT